VQLSTLSLLNSKSNETLTMYMCTLWYSFTCVVFIILTHFCGQSSKAFVVFFSKNYQRFNKGKKKILRRFRLFGALSFLNHIFLFLSFHFLKGMGMMEKGKM